MSRLVEAINEQRWADAIAWDHAAAVARTVPSGRIGTAITADVGTVLACIRAHESGDYGEHSHPDNGGSGAYQYLRSTWVVWSARAGFPGYAYPYEAPASVQDAVTAYALTHGGAGNWSPRYGDDPCTVGMGG